MAQCAQVGSQPNREVLAEPFDVAAADEPALVPFLCDGVNDVVGLLKPGDDADGVGVQRGGHGFHAGDGGHRGFHRGDALAAGHLDHELERGGRDVLGVHLLDAERVGGVRVGDRVGDDPPTPAG